MKNTSQPISHLQTPRQDPRLRRSRICPIFMLLSSLFVWLVAFDFPDSKQGNNFTVRISSDGMSMSLSVHHSLCVIVAEMSQILSLPSDQEIHSCP